MARRPGQPSGADRAHHLRDGERDHQHGQERKRTRMAVTDRADGPYSQQTREREANAVPGLAVPTEPAGLAAVQDAQIDGQAVKLGERPGGVAAAEPVGELVVVDAARAVRAA